MKERNMAGNTSHELPTTQSTPRTEEIERLCALIQLECSEPCGRLVRHLADEALRVGALERELAEEVEWNGPYRARLVREITEERAIVDRVWKALGIENYEQAKPYAIDEHVTNLRAALSSATEAKQALTKALQLTRAAVTYTGEGSPHVCRAAWELADAYALEALKEPS